jgi:hypothetical protein
VLPLGERALDELRFIRRTMEQASALTAFPGWGQVIVGATALGAAAVARRAGNATTWLGVWLAEAVLAVAIGSAAMAFKARATAEPYQRGAWRRFALTFSLPIVAGALITTRLQIDGRADALPGVWMLLYGVAIAAGGAFSVAAVRAMGYAFMALGGVALFGPAGGRDAWMAAGFGGLHIVFGAWIARRHGG